MTQRPYFSRINRLARFLSREDEHRASLLSELEDVHRDIGKYTKALQYFLSLSKKLAKQNPQSEQLYQRTGQSKYKELLEAFAEKQ